MNRILPATLAQFATTAILTAASLVTVSCQYNDAQPFAAVEPASRATQPVSAAYRITWRLITQGSQPPARHGHSMAYWQSYNRLVLAGGVDASKAKFTDTWVFDCVTEAWSQAPDSGSSTGMLVAPAFGENTAMVRGPMLVTAYANRETWYFTFSTDRVYRWYLANNTGPVDNGALAVVNGTAFLFGGLVAGATPDYMTYSWDSAHVAWAPLAKSLHLTTLPAAATTSDGSYVYVFGGTPADSASAAKLSRFNGTVWETLTAPSNYIASNVTSIAWAPLGTGFVSIIGGKTAVFTPPSQWTSPLTSVNGFATPYAIATCPDENKVVLNAGGETWVGTGQLDNGSNCTSSADCISNFCVDGLCCNTACTEPCHACRVSLKGGGEPGICGLVAAGSDPKDSCSQDPLSSCGQDGLCAGDGTCRLYASGTECQAVAFMADGSTLGSQRTCNGVGICSALNTTSCGAYLCENGACMKTCTNDTQCNAGYYCSDQHSCAAKKAAGVALACQSAAECLGGNCIDGYCCNLACGLQCEACDIAGKEGTCSPVAGASHGTIRAACTAAGTTCGGACDGQKRDGCSYPDSTKFCGTTGCSGSIFQPQVCDSKGACVDAATSDCGLYACDPVALKCRVHCSTNADCAAGSLCNANNGQCAPATASCKDAYTAITGNGTETSCSPYKCQTGTCRGTCDTSADCASGYDCIAQACVVKSSTSSGGASSTSKDAGTAGIGAPDNGTNSSNVNSNAGCGCRVGPGSHRNQFAAAIALGLLALARRRATRKRAERATRGLLVRHLCSLGGLAPGCIRRLRGLRQPTHDHPV